MKNFMNMLHACSCPYHPFLGSPPFSLLRAVKLHKSSPAECDWPVTAWNRNTQLFFFNTPSQRYLALVHVEVTGKVLNHRLTPFPETGSLGLEHSSGPYAGKSPPWLIGSSLCENRAPVCSFHFPRWSHVPHLSSWDCTLVTVAVDLRKLHPHSS